MIATELKLQLLFTRILHMLNLPKCHWSLPKKGGHASNSKCPFGNSRLHEELHQSCVTTGGGSVQGGPEFTVAGIDAGTRLEQAADQLLEVVDAALRDNEQSHYTRLPRAGTHGTQLPAYTSRTLTGPVNRCVTAHKIHASGKPQLRAHSSVQQRKLL